MSSTQSRTSGSQTRCMLWGVGIAATGGLLIVLPEWLGLPSPAKFFGAGGNSDARGAAPLVLAAGVLVVLIDLFYIALMALAGLVAGLCATRGVDRIGHLMSALVPAFVLCVLGGLTWAIAPSLYALIGPSPQTLVVLALAGLVAGWQAGDDHQAGQVAK